MIARRKQKRKDIVDPAVSARDMNRRRHFVRDAETCEAGSAGDRRKKIDFALQARDVRSGIGDCSRSLPLMRAGSQPCSGAGSGGGVRAGSARQERNKGERQRRAQYGGARPCRHAVDRANIPRALETFWRFRGKSLIDHARTGKGRISAAGTSI